MTKYAVGLKVMFGCAVASMVLGSAAQGQVRPTFSIDVQSRMAGGLGPNTGFPDGWFGIPLDEGSILTPARPGPPGPNPPGFPALAPLPIPGLMVGPLAGAGGSVLGGLGIVPGGPVGAGRAVELDALSYGHDLGIELMFSVDEWAGGDPFALFAPPNVFSEGPLSGVMEAAADVFRYNGPVVRTPPPPIGGGPGNKDFIDGNGFPSPAVGLWGLGLFEPMPPGCGMNCEGDNLDALDINSTLQDVLGPIFFSLDSSFIDPLDGPPLNTGTAIGNGFSGSDIIVSRAGGVPMIYAIAGSLGLDLAGFDTDDLDALIIQDNGDAQYDPAVDRILFSVRRGSAVIGMPDSMFGIPIEEGDVLSVPVPGGISPFPSIYIAAEALGLATVRSGTNELTPFGDELDALDLFLAGDLNGDGFVGIADLNIVLGNWNQPIPPGDPSADVNGDGFVGIADLNVVLGNWNTGAPLPPGGAVAVPEPATIVVLGLTGVALLRRRR